PLFRCEPFWGCYTQHDDKGFVDSGCSRHMTGNIAYLSDFKQFDGGYVGFRGGAYGGKISGKGTLKIANLDFKDERIRKTKRSKNDQKPTRNGKKTKSQEQE
ncbi:hypothetical protein Tco_0334270, partial [Tanacetum coccineum]